MQEFIYEVHDLEAEDIPLKFWDDFNVTSPPNWHKNIELLYFVSGKATLNCGGIEQEMIPGHIYCLNAGDIHSAFNHGLLHYYCLILDYNFLAQNKLHVEDLRLKTDVHSEQAGALFLEIVQDIQHPVRFSSARIRGNLISLMILLYQEHSVPYTDHKNRSLPDINAAIKAAVKYIDANYSQKLTLEDIAKASGFSKYHFARQFKQATGMTVVAYINLIRCQHAKNLIAKRRFSIQQVAARCGFDNASYFSHVFQNVVGLLPSEYLKQLPEKGP